MKANKAFRGAQAIEMLLLGRCRVGCRRGGGGVCSHMQGPNDRWRN